MRYDTVKETVYEWARDFNAIPRGIVEKLIKATGSIDDAIWEVTPPSVGNAVYIFNEGIRGEVIQRLHEDEYQIELDSGEQIDLVKDNFEVEYYDYLPIWSTMWAFNCILDNYWLSDGGLYLMADCGFRIYEQEDYGYIFGIDGCGYDFYEAHWIPLYKARGLHWNKEKL